MERQTTGTIIATAKQWWLKVNSKPVRMRGSDGAAYPYIIKVKYHVGGREHTKKKWLHAGGPVPEAGNKVQVVYSADKPDKAKIL